jgi:hypothetical protein
MSLVARRRLLDVLLERVTVCHDRTLRLELHIEWRTGVADVIETLRPLPPRNRSAKWTGEDDDVLRRFYTTEPDPDVILGQRQSVRTWDAVTERAAKLGLRRSRSLTPRVKERNDGTSWYPRQDSNLCFRLRRPTLYPLSYGGVP